MSSSNAENKSGIIILGINIHCDGCANEVRKHLRGFEGVEGVEIDGENNKVSVKGKMADPIKVRDWLTHKIRWKHVELISPKPSKPKQDKKEVEKKQPAEAKVIELVLKINMHCESCVKEVRHCILKMEGVERVDPNMEKNEVCVKGTMNPQKLLEFINKTSTGRHAKIVKVVELNKNNNNKGGKPEKTAVKQTATNTTTGQVNNNKGNGNKDNVAAGDNQLRLVYAPQLFSDENPNSCSVL